jgi:hypothetical protein
MTGVTVLPVKFKSRLDGLTRRQTLLDRTLIISTGHSECPHKLDTGRSLVCKMWLLWHSQETLGMLLDESEEACHSPYLPCCPRRA